MRSHPEGRAENAERRGGRRCTACSAGMLAQGWPVCAAVLTRPAQEEPAVSTRRSYPGSCLPTQDSPTNKLFHAKEILREYRKDRAALLQADP